MSNAGRLPTPLVQALIPSVDGEGPRARVVDLLEQVRDCLRERQPAVGPLSKARYEIYRRASTSFGDPWWVSRVADLEEWTAAHAVQCNDLETAWHAWRAGWWVRHLLREQGGEGLWAHSDEVMQTLRVLTNRTN